jgi:three-Cys-motif partner protein
MYIDGFAGSGGRTVERIISRTSPLFGTIESSEKIEAPGSARIALETDPPFHRMVLIERHGRRFSALKELCAQYPHVRVEALKEEANEALVPLHSGFDGLNLRWLQRGQEGVIDEDSDTARHPWAP